MIETDYLIIGAGAARHSAHARGVQMIPIIERLQGRRDGLRDNDPTCGFRSPDLPHEDAEASMRPFVIEVLPDVEARPGATRGARS